MEIGFYDLLVRTSELLGCTSDEALIFGAFVWFIFIAMLAWAIWFAMDLGRALYKATKQLFRFIRGRHQRKEKVEP